MFKGLLEKGRSLLGGDPKSEAASDDPPQHTLRQGGTTTLLTIMTPRADIEAVDRHASLDDVTKILIKKRFISIPVFRGRLDSIVGAIAFDGLLKCYQTNKTDWKRWISPIPCVPSSMSLANAQIHLEKDTSPFLLTIDEYGGVDGLVSLHRLARSLMMVPPPDNFDPFEPPLFLENKTTIVDGRTPIPVFEATFGPLGQNSNHSGHEMVETIGGFITLFLERLPSRGEVITMPSGIKIEILRTDSRRVERFIVLDHV